MENVIICCESLMCENRILVEYGRVYIKKIVR